MAEETQVEEQPQEPQGEAEQPKPETDWKAEARKWEARAKKSEAAEAELDALKQAQMTEQEKATARAEKAEAELAEAKAEQQRIRDAREIAERENVPLELVEFCADAEAMEAFAARYKAANPPQQVHAAPRSSGPRIVRDGEAAQTNAQRFAQFVEPMFKH